MKKIMFNDKYRLTKAVLDGRKTMTRRVINLTDTDKEYLYTAFDWGLRESVIIERYAKYKVGEVVAIAQSYNNCMYDAHTEIEIDGKDYLMCETKGWNNKMFVRAKLMLHRIKITDVRVEQLKDISDEDCLREGVGKCKEEHIVGYPFGVPFNFYIKEDVKGNRYSTPREAFSVLIDKVSGKGTWDNNPFVFVYEFEIID